MTRYISQSTVSFSISINEREKRIRFTQATQGGSSYLCDDPKVCKLIEARSDFGVVYFLDPNYEQSAKPVDDRPPVAVETPKAPEAKATESPAPDVDDHPPIVDLVEVPDINTLSEAKDYLLGMGAQAAAVRSRDGIFQTAQELNVSFPNLK